MHTTISRLSALIPLFVVTACGGDPSFLGASSSHSALGFYTAPASGLVGSYAGDVDGSDSARGHHGLLIGGATIGAGQVGRGFRFDGQAAGVRVPDHEDFNFGAGSFTIETWVRVDPSVVEREYLGLVGKLDASGRGFTFFLGPPGHIGLQLANGASDFDNHFSPAPTARDGGWHHVAVTVDRLAGVRFFVDGVTTEAEPQQYRIPTDVSNEGDLFIGRHWSQLLFSLAGELDEVRLYASVNGAAPYAWITGPWGACSALCGAGTRTRSVICRGPDGAIAPDSSCTGTRPADTGDCTFCAPATVVARDHRTFALKLDGTLWATGSNGYGQLGDGTTTDRSSFVQVLGGVSGVAAGIFHTAALKSDGTLWVTGYYYLGQVDDEATRTARTSFVQVLGGVSSVASGGHHTLALKPDGTLWAMGYNAYGQLGDGTTTNRTSFVQVASGVSGIAAGYSHSLVLRADGALWVTGGNSDGQLGDGTTRNRSSFVQVASGVSGIAAGGYHSLVLMSNGTLWATGDNFYGQLGDGTTTDRTSLTQVLRDVSSATGGLFHSLALKSDGTLWATGYNAHGQLGDGTTTSRSSFVQVLRDVSMVTGGGYHSAALRPDRTLWATGYDYHGQLGDGMTTDRSSFVQVSIP